jgi:outer membrane protein assembly factor BamD
MRRRFHGVPVLLAVVALLVSSAGCGSFHRRGAEQGKGLLVAEELYARATGEMERRHFTKAKSLLESMQFNPENRPTMEPQVRLALADVLFYTGDTISLIDARSKYVEFVTLYGTHPRAPYAQFQAGVCSLKQISSPARDQSQTRAALADLEEVGTSYPGSVYAGAARGMIARAEANLAEHEFVVGSFYLKRGAYSSSAERFKEILERYPRYAEKQKVYLELGRSLILAKNRVEGTIYLDKLVSDYPEDARAAEARKLLASLPATARDGANAGDPAPR